MNAAVMNDEEPAAFYSSFITAAFIISYPVHPVHPC
jgi:hypothetical protein